MWNQKKKKDNAAAGEIYGVMNEGVRPNPVIELKGEHIWLHKH